MVSVQIHPAFEPLMKVEHSFASVMGGRGGMKSEQVHKIALLEAIAKPLRVCNARETMSSIKDSSHKLLVDSIYEHQMARSQNGPYEIQEQRILRRDGDQVISEFMFVGVRENVRDSKSLKGINLTIVEEAGKVSQDSWNVFIPTVMRESGSRLWAIWNPELTTDPTWKLFMQSPPPGTIHIKTTYLDNPWCSDSLRSLAEHCRDTDPAKYRHVWLGEPITDVSGAIFQSELRAMDEGGRVCSVPYDPTLPVYTAWDLGYGDPTAIWFVQRYDGRLNFIDYYSAREKTLADHVIALQAKGYIYGEDHLPHDAVDSIIHRRLMGSGDKSMSIQVLLANAGRKVVISPKLLKAESLNAARTIFPLCRFDQDKCAEGLQSLRHYQWDRMTTEKGQRKPQHDWASHAADAFMTAAVSIRRVEQQAYEAALLRQPRPGKVCYL
jgi:phage terminase large subunit